MWIASDSQPPPASSTALMVVALIGATIFMLGYRIAVNRRANSDYKKTKAALPGLRKSFWQSWWAAARIVALTFLAAALLLSWAVHDARQLAGR